MQLNLSIYIYIIYSQPGYILLIQSLHHAVVHKQWRSKKSRKCMHNHIPMSNQLALTYYFFGKTINCFRKSMSLIQALEQLFYYPVVKVWRRPDTPKPFCQRLSTSISTCSDVSQFGTNFLA